MKRITYTLAALYILLLCSCDKPLKPQDWTKPVSGELSLKCTAALSENEYVIWSEKDEIGVFCEEAGITNASVTAAAASAGETDGMFYPHIAIEEGKELELSVYYPYSKSAKEDAIPFGLSKTLSQAEQSYAHLNQMNLFQGTGKWTGDIGNTVIEVRLQPVLKMCAINIKSVKYAGCSLDKVAVKTCGGETLSGEGVYNPQNGEIRFSEQSGELTVNVNGLVLSETDSQVWFLMPAADFKYEADMEVSITKGESNVLLSGTVNLVPATAVNLDTFKSSEVEDSSINLADPDGDGTLETANCYVAGIAGQQYRFPATVMGNGYTTAPDDSYTISEGVSGSSPGITPQLLAPRSAKILWQTEPDLLSNVTLKNDCVYFNTNGETGGKLSCGNAVLAVYETEDATGDILWSWHIWVTDADLDGSVQTWKVNASLAEYPAYQNPVLMDRNLGAISARGWEINGDNLDYGLYYEWGRKDPFIGIDDSKWGSTAIRTTYDSDGNTIPVAMAFSTEYSAETKWTFVKAHLRKADLAKYPMAFYYSGTTKNNQVWLEDVCHDLWGCPGYPDDSNKLGHKTIYDPCPPGYRVMNAYVMSGITPTANGGKYASMESHKVLNNTTYNTGKEALQVQCNDTDTAYLPGTGMLRFEANSFPAYRTGSYGYIWTAKMSSTTSGKAYRLHFDTATFETDMGFVSYGHSVRCERIK